MIVKRPINCTRVIGQPANWDESKHGSCVGLPVEDCAIGELAFMKSVWEPTPYELELLNKGASVELYVNGVVHPIVSMCIGQPQQD